jgi:short-subunit dehydrogenase
MRRYPGIAVVTGASSGIGAAFARRLSSEGYDVAIAARRGERLESLAKDLPTRAIPVSVDLATREGCEALVEAVAGEEVGVLVHAAGFGCMGHFETLSVDRQLQMVDLNARAAVHLSARLAPGMCSRGAGAMILVSSISAFQASPWLAAYGATKSFVLSLAEALHVEYATRGIDVLALCPGPTRTEFADVAAVDAEPPEQLWSDAAAVVQSGLDALGKRPFVVHGASNRISAWLASLLPRHLAARISGRVMKEMSKRLQAEAAERIAPRSPRGAGGSRS